MKKILFLVICFLNLSKIKSYYVKGKLSKDGFIIVTEENSCVYLDTNEFENNDEIIIKLTLDDSISTETKMYYGESNNIENSISLTNSKPYFFSNSKKIRSDFYSFSYYFNIPVSSSKRYLYVSIPTSSKSYPVAFVQIKDVISGLSEYNILIIVSVVIAVIDIVVIIIAIICYRKKNEEIIAPQDE